MKEKFHTTGVHDSRKSDNNIVPEKAVNNECRRSAEQLEGRALTKGNTTNTAVVRTQRRGATSIGLEGVRRKADEDKTVRFNNLFHHITPELLTQSFYALKRDAAPGVDGQTWQMYKKDLTNRIVELHRLLHTGSYRALP